MINIRNLGSKESVGVKFNEGIRAKLYLKLYFESERFVDLVRVPYLHIISRNHSNTLSLTYRKQKLVRSKALRQDFDSVDRFLSTT